MKRLRSTTIVPQGLYVQREADRQLRRNLREMGRPAYVLVARQMGKTNLLLSAKRDLEGVDDAFVYNDLSNVAPTSRDCLRSIVDIALETHHSKFESVAVEVFRRRGLAELPPAHIEHDRELRLLLSAIAGNLVIILDEVDALTNATFSDQIFAQIRSTYFSRANYAEFERLTYLLSGVAEPSELIKNKKLSPFNIGEKILLNDFTFEEVETFVRQAGLGFSEEVVRRIFHWANGNPRMTWDICSELEDGGTFSPQKARDVDTVVERLYLRSFDRAPVDHIRTLVESDRIIRSAITQIRYGKGSTLSDEVRHRLYLAGIVGAEQGAPAAVVKNQVIERALSEEWLRAVERRKMGALAALKDLLREGALDEVVRTGMALIGEELAFEDERAARELVSQAHFSQPDYERAISVLDGSLYDKKQHRTLYYQQQYRLGICHLKLRRNEESILRLREVVEGGEHVDDYLPALANLAAVLIRHDFKANEAEAISANERVIELVAQSSDPLPQDRQLAIAARYNLAEAFWLLGNREPSIEQLGLAISHAEGATRAMLEYRLSRRVDEGARRGCIVRACRLLSESSIERLSKATDNPLELTDDAFKAVLLVSFESEEVDAFGAAFARYAKVKGGERGALYHLVELAKTATSLNKIRLASGMLRWGVNEFPEASGGDLFEAARSLCYLDPAPTLELSDRFLAGMSGSGAPEAIDAMDFNALLGMIVRSNDSGETSRARQVLALLATYRGRTTGDLKPADFVLVDFLEMRFLEAEGRKGESAEYARSVLRAIPQLMGSSRGQKVVPLESLLTIRVQAEQIARRALPRSRKVGPNERVRVRYRDGNVIENKFKRLEADLIAGICTIVLEGGEGSDL